MNILGMGTLEILIVLLVAFIFLGPQRMVDAARLIGKASREVKKMSDELPRLIEDSVEVGPPEGTEPQTTDKDAASEYEQAEGGPVAFRAHGGPEVEEPPKDQAKS